MANKPSVEQKMVTDILAKRNIKYNDWIKNELENVGISLLRRTRNTYKDDLTQIICENFLENELTQYLEKNHPEPKVDTEAVIRQKQEEFKQSIKVKGDE